MASLPWVPWQTNRTEVLSQAQIERIVQMHRESKQNAVIYVMVVLVLYFVALAILVGRYLHHERDHDLAVCVGQALERCVATCRRATSASPGATPAAANLREGVKDGAKDGAKAPAPPVIAITAAAPTARKFSLKLAGWTAPSAHRVPRRARPRAPQTDDESSDCSSPPYSPAADGGDTLSAPSCEARDMDSSDGEAWPSQGPGACHLSGLPGRASPAVVSVMVCDLQDTQV